MESKSRDKYQVLTDFVATAMVMAEVTVILGSENRVIRVTSEERGRKNVEKEASLQ